MKKLYITLFIFLSVFSLGNAQSQINWQWTLGNGSTGSDDVADSKIDAQGNIVFGGRFSGTINLSATPLITQTSIGSSDCYVAKANPQGNVIWAKSMGGGAQDFVTAIDIDKNGDIVVLADFYDSIDYNPGATGSHTFYSNAGLSNILLSRYDANGNLLWAKNIGGNSIDRSNDLSIDTLGNIFVTGSFYKTASFNAPSTNSDTLRSKGGADIFLAKYSANGTFQWVKQIGSTGNEAPSRIITDNQNGVYLTGTYTDLIDFNPSPTDSIFLDTTSWGSNVFLEKFDNNGNFQWANAMTSVGFKSIGDLALDDNNRLYVCGRFNGTTNFNTEFGYDTLYALPGNSSIYFGVYNNNGSLAWMKKIEHGYQGGQDAGTAIAIDSKKDIYITGQFWGQGCDFNTSPVDSFLLGSNSSNNYDIFLAKYSNTGNFKWAYNIGDAGSDVGVNINFDATGELYFAANVQYGSSSGNGPIDFDVSPTGTYYYTPSGSSDFTLTKFSQCVLDDAAVLSSNGITAFAGGLQYQWVNCGVGFAPISGATSQTYMPTATGNYACILTSSATCKDTTACLFFDVCANFSNSVTMSNTGIMTSSVSNATSYQWLTCEANATYTAIAGATSQSFTPAQNGSYACKAVKGGCVDTSDCKQISNVGFNDVANESNFIFYPNPAKTILNVESANMVYITVLDVIGNELQVVSTHNAITSLNVEQLPAGVYFVRCKMVNNKNIIRKFIKQ
jgi:hypothetical protein